MYGDDNDALERFFEHLVEDLAMLGTQGVILSDGLPFWLIPLGVKGDWPFLDVWLRIGKNHCVFFIFWLHVLRSKRHIYPPKLYL